MSLISGSKSVSSSPLQKLHYMGPNPVHSLELPQAYMFKEQKIKFSQEYPLMRQDANTGSQRDSSVKASVFAEANGVDLKGNCCSDGLFASSLSEIFDNKCEFLLFFSLALQFHS